MIKSVKVLPRFSNVCYRFTSLKYDVLSKITKRQTVQPRACLSWNKHRHEWTIKDLILQSLLDTNRHWATVAREKFNRRLGRNPRMRWRLEIFLACGKHPTRTYSKEWNLKHREKR